MYFLIVTAGMIAGSLHDPVFWVCLAGAAAAALFRMPFVVFLGAAIAGFTIRTMISVLNRATVGAENLTISVWGGLATVIAMATVFLIVYALRRATGPQAAP